MLKLVYYISVNIKIIKGEKMSVRIVCINKDNGNHENPHEAISHYGWANESTNSTGKNDRLSMVNWVKKGNKAYVKDRFGNVAYCMVRKSPKGTEFLQTVSDGRYTNNLLSLPECQK